MNPSPQSRFRYGIDLVAALAVILTAGVVVWANVSRAPAASAPPTKPHMRPEPIPTEPISLEDAFLKGNAAARVAIVEYADLQCPACARFVTHTYPDLVAKYVDKGLVRFGFKHYPLPSHRFARGAALAAQCAGDQGKFWETYEAVYQKRPKLDQEGLQSIVGALGLDRPRWSRCVDSEAGPIVDRAVAEGKKLQLNGTPTFLIGTVTTDGRLRATSRVYGAQPLAAFDRAISDAQKVAAEIGANPKRSSK